MWLTQQWQRILVINGNLLPAFILRNEKAPSLPPPCFHLLGPLHIPYTRQNIGSSLFAVYFDFHRYKLNCIVRGLSYSPNDQEKFFWFLLRDGHIPRGGIKSVWSLCTGHLHVSQLVSHI